MTSRNVRRMRALTKLAAFPGVAAVVAAITMLSGAAQGVTWVSQFGTSGHDIAWGVARDGTGNVYVAGHTEGALPGQNTAGGIDAFLRKSDATGAEIWTRQFGTA